MGALNEPKTAGVSAAQLRAQILALQAENEALKARKGNGGAVSLKVSVKGCVSAYGLGRIPSTLYAGQWLRLLDSVGESGIRQFIAENVGTLSWKGDAPESNAILAMAPVPTANAVANGVKEG